MIKRFWNYLLDQSATGCMWLALHLECWRIGHDWQAVGPDYAWCEHCEDQSKGERARIIFEAKYGPYVEPPGAPWPPMVTDIDLPSDAVYFVNLSDLPLRAIAENFGNFVASKHEYMNQELLKAHDALRAFGNRCADS